jgi:hypothetical protein
VLHFVLALVDSNLTHSYWLFLKRENRKCCEDVWIYLCVEGGVGLGTEFRSEIIPRNILGAVSVILLNKVLIPRHCQFRGRTNSEARNGMVFREKISLQNT